MALIFSLGGLIVWYAGGREVLGGRMTLGSLMAFLAYLTLFYAPLTTLSHLTTWLTSFMTGCSRVFELLDTPTETHDPVEPVPMPVARGEIRFEDVTFGYERHRPVFNDVSFTIRPGERIGIVGRSGSGKTTLVNLISRFYDVENRPRAARRRRRARAVRQATSAATSASCFRSRFFSAVPSATTSSTAAPIRTLLMRSRPPAQHRRHDFIVHKPLGYDTWLGERGAGLSGGEKQRVSIARALLYDPRVLILDEATSSIDTESEKAIQQALRVLTRGRTTLAIAHRLSTLCDSDRILVFDDGRLIEQGTHGELLALDGRYAALVKAQTQIARNSHFETALKTLGDTPPDEPEESEDRDDTDFAPQWIEPDCVDFRAGTFASLEMVHPDGRVIRSVFAIQCLPATSPDDFISLRTWGRDGHESELGILRNLNSWSPRNQKLVREALARRYFLRRITGIDSIKLDCGYVLFQVRTDRGPAEFTMRWTQSQVQDFGAARQGAARCGRQPLPGQRRRRIATARARCIPTLRLLVNAVAARSALASDSQDRLMVSGCPAGPTKGGAAGCCRGIVVALRRMSSSIAPNVCSWRWIVVPIAASSRLVV